jgi:hypothetical protein
MKHIHVATCTPMAVEIANRTLRLSQQSEEFDVVELPLFRNDLEHANIAVLLKTSIESVQALAKDKSTPLAVGVMREWVCERSASRRFVSTYSVGLIVTCYLGTPLALWAAQDWLPCDKGEIFNEAAAEILAELQNKKADPPQHIVELSTLLGNKLMAAIEIPVEEKVCRLQ